MAPPRGHVFNKGLYIYREKHETIFVSETNMARVIDICYVASPSKPLPSLFKLYP